MQLLLFIECIGQNRGDRELRAVIVIKQEIEHIETMRVSKEDVSMVNLPSLCR